MKNLNSKLQLLLADKMYYESLLTTTIKEKALYLIIIKQIEILEREIEKRETVETCKD